MNAHVPGQPGYHPPVIPCPLISGLFVGPGEAGSAFAMTQSLLLAVPVVFDRDGTLNRISLNCTIVAASSTVRVGVYADNGLFYPGALITDYGTVDTTTGVAVKPLTISTPVKALKLYWLACAAQGGAPTVTSMSRHLAHVPQTGETFAISRGYQQAAVTGALPANFSTTKADLTGFAVRLLVRGA